MINFNSQLLTRYQIGLALLSFEVDICFPLLLLLFFCSRSFHCIHIKLTPLDKHSHMKYVIFIWLLSNWFIHGNLAVTVRVYFFGKQFTWPMTTYFSHKSLLIWLKWMTLIKFLARSFFSSLLLIACLLMYA